LYDNLTNKISIAKIEKSFKTMFNHTCIMSITVNHDLVKMRMQVQAPMVESPTGQGKQLTFKVILNGPTALFTLQSKPAK